MAGPQLPAPAGLPEGVFTHVVATLGSAGDLHPFLAIARALREQGHRVLMLAQAPWRDEIEAQGVSFAAIASEHDHWRTAQHPLLWHPIKGFGVLWRHLAVPAIGPTLSALDTLSQRLERTGAPALRVLASPLVVGARLAQERWPERFHLSTGHTAPAGMRSCQHPMHIAGWALPSWLPERARAQLWHWLDTRKLEPMAAPALRHWRGELGLPALEEPVFQRWIHSSQQVLALFPADFGPMPTDWPVQPLFTGFPLYESAVEAPIDPELAEFVADERHPLVVIYPGSAPTRQAQRLRELARTLAHRGLRCLLLSADPTQDPGQVPPQLLLRNRVQLPMILPRASLFMHHGGIGACAQGIAANTRQWGFPSAYDQFDNTWRLSLTTPQPTHLPNPLLIRMIERSINTPLPQPRILRTMSDRYSWPECANGAVSAAVVLLA